MTRPPWPPVAIRLLILDVDGTLTDGGMYFAADGQIMKRFDVYDGLGIVGLQRAGVEVALISGDSSPIIRARAERLGIHAVMTGHEDKADVVRRLLDERGLSPDQALYMGDDVNDLPAMAEVSHSAAPANAVPQVKQAVDYVATNSGGCGAVREVCDLIAASLAEQ
jgi:3-deoxy-D-manno-octulosonate 8-phosphate phosphatase (KDO 8-P phosphatase)